MRLYRGLKEHYQSEKALAKVRETRQGIDCTDCPYTALLYAGGRRGVLLVLDVPPDAGILVSEELWLGPTAKRFMIWGRFDDCVVAVIPAKELRAEVRRKGVVRLSDADKGAVLKRVIERRLAAEAH